MKQEIINNRTLSEASYMPLFDMNCLKWQVNSFQKVNYSVSLNRELLNPENDVFANVCGADGEKINRRLVVIDSKVADLYEKNLNSYFRAWNISPIWKIIAGDEASKTMRQTLEVSEAMIDAGLLRRAEAVIAIGGGVVLDVVGFAASLYRRGIPYIRIPTTLMGQIDAGIGIKTGVNYGQHKNRLGTYFPPVAALIDPMFLQTLDERHIINGISEIIKIALIKDKVLFQVLEQEAHMLNSEFFSENSHYANEIFAHAIAGMLEELEPNLWESNLERSVDYGHTFSPLLELCAEPMLLHGEAVAIDMALSIAIACGRKLITSHDAHRALNLIMSVGLPIIHQNFTLKLVEKALADSIRHRDGLQRIPLTDGIGKVIFVNDLSQSELNTALEYVHQFSNNIYGQHKVS